MGYSEVVQMTAQSLDSFATLSELEVASKKLRYYSLEKFARASKTDLARMPFSLKILLENLLRMEDGKAVYKKDIEGLAVEGEAAGVGDGACGGGVPRRKFTIPEEAAFPRVVPPTTRLY